MQSRYSKNKLKAGCAAAFTILFFATTLTGTTMENKFKDMRARVGHGKINSIEVPIFALDDFKSASDLKEILQTNFKGIATVTEEQMGPLRVFVVANVRSSQCPNCLAITPTNYKKIVEESYTVSMVELEEATFAPFAIAAPSGKILEKIAQAQTYQGKILKHSAKNLIVDAQSEFIFNRSYSFQLDGEIQRSLSVVKNDLSVDLRQAGYREFNPSPANLVEELPKVARPTDHYSQLWQNKSSIIYTELQPIQNGQHTRINFHEVITR